MGGLRLTVGLVGVCDCGLLFEPPESTSFLFNHFRSSKNPASGGKGLVRGLHYSKAKGGSHENQDEREGWHHEIELIGQGKLSEITNQRGKEDAMKTKTNVKAGLAVHTAR